MKHFAIAFVLYMALAPLLGQGCPSQTPALDLNPSTVQISTQQLQDLHVTPPSKDWQRGSINGIVRDEANQIVTGATVSAGDYSTTSNSQGAYTLSLPVGLYSIMASAPGYLPSNNVTIQVISGQDLSLNFVLNTLLFYNDGFENYPDFTQNIAPWIPKDVDLCQTYGITGTSWPNQNEPMAYMIFNPSATVPPLLDFSAQEGNKFAVSFAVDMPPNNDWLISPLIEAGFISFWARSYPADGELARFKIGISTGSTFPQAFQYLSGPDFLEAPANWTQYQYLVPPEFYYQNIRIGIRCSSDANTVFALDNFRASGITSQAEDINAPVLSTHILPNFPNPFNPETTIPFILGTAGAVNLSIYNLKGQLVRTLINRQLPAGYHSVVWNGMDEIGRVLAGGIYYCKLSSGGQSDIRKMILMK